jgi:hypothetical protein
MNERRKGYAIRGTAGVFGISGSAYYRRAKYGVSERRREADAELVRLILLIVAERHRRYGSLRVLEALRREYGNQVSGPINAGERLKRPAEAEIHPRHQLKPQIAGPRKPVEP